MCVRQTAFLPDVHFHEYSVGLGNLSLVQFRIPFMNRSNVHFCNSCCIFWRKPTEKHIPNNQTSLVLPTLLLSFQLASQFTGSNLRV